MVNWLAAQGADVRGRGERGGTTLHFAAALGRAKLVRTLVGLGADVNVRDDATLTPLHCAAGTGSLEVV